MSEPSKEEQLHASIDSASAAIEQLQENVTTAIAAEKSGWFGARIKLIGGVATVVQVTTDEEIAVANAAQKRRRKRGPA